jgi:hypothetical protein
MSLKDLMLQDAVNVIMHKGEFAEEITYTSYGGVAKVINAVVVRNKLQPDSQVNNKVLAGQAEIQIANNATYGIEVIYKGRDLVSLPERLGEDPITYRIVDILGQDDGIWHLLAMK